MSAVSDDLKFSKSHEWVRQNADGTVTIGISDHAQAQLGDLVYVEIPEAGRDLAAGDACAVVESVKAASDVYTPLAGTVVAGNDALTDAPEAVNTDPYGAGWLLKLTPTDATAINGLMSASDYQAFVDAE